MTNPSQLMSCHPKDKWSYFNNSVLSYTDIVDLQPNSKNNEHGIVFYDLKVIYKTLIPFFPKISKTCPTCSKLIKYLSFSIFSQTQSRLVKRPKEFRSPPSSDSINQLQINQISFNRSEMSYRFYALAYETGFVRIRHLKNSK
jgi:hypothetical protein